MTPEQKQKRIQRALQHQEQDRLLSGCYIEGEGSSRTHRGCSVGCDAIDIQLDSGIELRNLNDNDCHNLVSEHDGTPAWLEHLRDSVFEGLDSGKRSWWHVELAKSLPAWEDSEGSSDPRWVDYFHRVCIAILNRTLKNRDCWSEPYLSEVVAAIEQAIDYHKTPSESAAESAAESAESAESAAWSAESAARSAARSAESAARSAAWSAWLAWSAESAESAESAAWSAARLAAWSARSAAESAAWSAARLAARSAAWSAAWSDIATDVITTFKHQELKKANQ